MAMVRAVLRFLGYVFLFLLLLAVCTITTVDWTPYRETAYYQKTMEHLEGLEWDSSDQGYLVAGWAKANITPPHPKPLIPYKPRGNYEYVLDSNYVRTLVIGNSLQQVAFINYEILFVHPYLAQQVKAGIRNAGLSIDYVYFTTTHTHSGFGGFSPGLVGKLTMGGHDEEVIELLTTKTVESLQYALQNKDTVDISFRKTLAGDYVANRLVHDDPIEPYVRQLYLKKRSGETCSLITYSAHATLLPGSFMGLSGDYPHYLNELREETIDFSIFAAGTVGSHRPVGFGANPEGIETYAFKLDSVINADSIQPRRDTLSRLRSGILPVHLRSAHFRISDNLRLRPWLFDLVYGESSAHLDVLQIGNNLFISSSGEVSGVFYEKWDRLAAKKGLNLFVTCFNGGYIGYITPDKYYHEKLYEVRDMNFFGPYNGAYHDELIERVIEKAGN